MKTSWRFILAMTMAWLSLAGCVESKDDEMESSVVRVLMIGNSFSISCMNHLPQVAADLKIKLDLASLFIGGCSLKQHWENALSNEVATVGQPYRPYYFTRNECGVATRGNINVLDALRLAKWDIVTIQQASHDSWRADTYHPYGDKLIAKIRELAPQAKIVVQETWSYTPWDWRLKEWKIDQNEMYSRLHAAYGDFAKAYGLAVIPVGTAVQVWRQKLPVKYTASSFGGDVVGGGHELDPKAHFVRDGADGYRPACDVFHLNSKGEYFQALVWAAKLLDAPVADCAYRPNYVSDDEFKLMNEVISQVVP